MDAQFENLINFVNDVDYLAEDTTRIKLPKVYMRDVINPFTFYTDDNFKLRYRFSKDVVLNVILPELRNLTPYNSRGLPIALEMQLLITLRFFATGSFQVSKIKYKVNISLYLILSTYLFY